MSESYVHQEDERDAYAKRNWMPKQTMWRVDDDHSLRRMQFEAAVYGLERDRKYNLVQYLYEWYGWHGYFSWRDLPKDCSQLMGLYVGEINRIAQSLEGFPARAVGMMMRHDPEQIVPVRVEQAGAMLSILRSIPSHKRADWLLTKNNYIATRPDFEMQGAAFGITEVGAANFIVKAMLSGMVPGCTGWYEVTRHRQQPSRIDPLKRSPDAEHARNLLHGLKFDKPIE